MFTAETQQLCHFLVVTSLSANALVSINVVYVGPGWHLDGWPSVGG